MDGRVEGHRDGHGFVIPDNGEPAIYLSPQEMRSVLHRDRVRTRVLRLDRKGRPEGRVLDILERRKTPIIGRLLHEGGQWVVAPEDSRYGQDILIPKNATASAAVGQVVSVELTEPPSLHSQPVGRVAEVLGEIDDAGMEIAIAVRKYEVPHQFSAETLAAAAALPDRIRPADRKHRVDLTDVPLVTIDGEDARDFDDAVYCEPFKRGRGGQRLRRELVRDLVLAHRDLDLHAGVVDLAQHLGDAAHRLRMQGRRFGQLHRHDLPHRRAGGGVLRDQDVLAVAPVFRGDDPLPALVQQAADDRRLAPLQDVEHTAFGAALAVQAQHAHAHAVAVQHAAHLLRRQVDGRIAVVGDDKTVAVAMTFDTAIGFAAQGGAGGCRA